MVWAEAFHNLWYWSNKEAHDDSSRRPANLMQYGFFFLKLIVQCGTVEDEANRGLGQA